MTIDLQVEKIFDNWPESWKKHLTIDLQVKKITCQLTCNRKKLFDNWLSLKIIIKNCLDNWLALK